MRIAVTGGAGFIGQAVVAHAEKQGHEVWTFDAADGFDIRNIGFMEERLTGAEVVIHLAGRLGTSELFLEPYDAIDANKLHGYVREQAAGLEQWLSGLCEELRAKTYRPQAVRRVMIPKPSGGERPLGIPTIRDRVVQMAVKLVIEPILEADLDDSAYGYRPKRDAADAPQATAPEPEPTPPPAAVATAT